MALSSTGPTVTEVFTCTQCRKASGGWPAFREHCNTRHDGQNTHRYVGKDDTRSSSMGRRPIRTASEQDAFTPWRRILCYLQRPGITSKVKAAANRRDRRTAKHRVWDGWE